MEEPGPRVNAAPPAPGSTWQQLRRQWQGLRPWERGNLLAGLTVTTYLVPQVMAYSTVAGLPPIAGLWASLPALVVYALIGTSRLLSIGPESSVALMTAAVVAPLAMGNQSEYVALAAGLALAVAAVCALATLLRLSFVSQLLSRPVLVGYMAGIAVLMIEGQLPTLLGVQTEGDSFAARVGSLVQQLDRASLLSMVTGLAVMVGIFLLARWPRIPGALIAIAAAGVVGWLLGASFEKVGEVPQGLPMPALPDLDLGQVQSVLLGAIGVSIVAFSDSTLTARAFRERSDEPIEPSRDLAALSLANAGAGLMQGMPVSSSGSRTALAKAGGASSQGYSLVVAVGLLLVLLFAGPVLSGIPRTAMAGLVIYAALQLIDVAEIRHLWQFRRVELLLAVFTFAAVLLLGVLYGVLAAIGLSVIELLARVARPHSASLGFAPDVAGMHDIGDYPSVREEPGLLVFRYDSPLFFANAEDFRRSALVEVARRQPGLRWCALNCEAIVEIDSTAVAALDDLQRDLAAQGVRLVLVRAKRELIEDLEPTGLLDRIGREHDYPTLPTMVAAYRARWPADDEDTSAPFDEAD